MEEKKMNFHNRLREERNKLNLTQEALADTLEINRTTYAKYETGENQPNINRLVLFAEFFGVSLDYLLGVNLNSSLEKSSILCSKELNDIIRNTGLENVKFLDIENWRVLDSEDISDINKYFDLVVYKAKSRANSQ